MVDINFITRIVEFFCAEHPFHVCLQSAGQDGSKDESYSSMVSLLAVKPVHQVMEVANKLPQETRWLSYC